MRLAIVTLLCVAAVRAQPPASGPVIAGDGSVAGAVVNAVSQEPVKKAQVYLSGPVSLNAVTDSSGHFRFLKLPPGIYVLQASQALFPPSRQARFGNTARVILSSGEEKSGVALALTPGANIAGRVADEEGAPISGCSVSAAYLTVNGGQQLLIRASAATTDDRGDYRLAVLPSGRYYVHVACNRHWALPHAFVPRDQLATLPAQTFAALFYPGSPDLGSASAVNAAPGADVSGIDFRLPVTPSFTVQAHLTGMEDAAELRRSRTNLQLRDEVLRDFGTLQARVSPRTAAIVVQSVRPGAYWLTVQTNGSGGRTYFGRVAVDVGTSPPEPVEVPLAPAPDVTGVLVAEDADANLHFENFRVVLTPNGMPLYGPQPTAVPAKDGTFTLTNVIPGRWRIYVNGLSGYVRSVSAGGQDLSPYSLDLSAGSGPLRVVLGVKTAALEGTVSDAGPETGGLWVVATPVEPDRMQTGLDRAVAADAQGHFSLSGLVPGKYRVCAIAGLDAYPQLVSPLAYQALGSRCETVELEPGGKGTVQVQASSREELQRAAEAAGN